MNQLSKKYIAILLTILLVLLPLQNLMAESISCADSGEGMPHHMMVMADTAQAHSMHDMADDSQQNVKMNCCDDVGCVLGHCFTSTATLYTTIVIPVSSQMDTHVLPHVSQFISQTFSPLFRPPIA